MPESGLHTAAQIVGRPIRPSGPKDANLVNEVLLVAGELPIEDPDADPQAPASRFEVLGVRC